MFVKLRGYKSVNNSLRVIIIIIKQKTNDLCTYTLVLKKKLNMFHSQSIFLGIFIDSTQQEELKKEASWKNLQMKVKTGKKIGLWVCGKKIVFYATEQKILIVRVKCSLCYLGGRSIDGRDSLVHLDGYSVSSYGVFCFFGKLNFIETNHNTKPPGHIPENQAYRLPGQLSGPKWNRKGNNPTELNQTTT